MDTLVGALCELAPEGLANSRPTAVHHARVATRRLKAALDLLEPVLDTSAAKRLGKRLRRLRRKLGPLRDLDVMLSHIAELTGDGAHALAGKWLKARLLAERRQMCESAGADAGAAAVQSGKRWEKLRSRVLALEPRLAGLLATSLTAQLKEFARQSDLLAAGQAGGRQDPHAVRIAGKLLRYTLEIAAATGGPLPPEHLKTFKRLQDALGLWHDHVVLMRVAMQAAIDEDLAAHRPQAHRDLLGLISASSLEAGRSLERFASLWSDRGAELKRDIAALAEALRVSAAACTGTRSNA